jgi:LmbE family N-acetylglucosaminyl deacetylase
MRKYLLLIYLFCLSSITFSQSPKTYSSSQIFEQIKKLNVLGSVLYVAAHPDDENTRLLAYLANDKLYRTGYLAMTRGDGGQNLIGDEQGIELGLIRTQELLAARRIDGAEQFFTRAFDFGYTKSPEETFDFWNKEKILSDVVWVIRKFQPDVIITRFPTTGEGGHGHHTASAILAGEAFEAAADPNRFPEQIKYGVKPWQAKRLLWNTFNFGSVNTERPDQFQIDAGGYNSLLGKSYGEIAAESRSQHKSQGFGVPSSRGKQMEFFKTIKGTPPQKSLMDNVVTDWKRLNEVEIESAINEVIKNYSFRDPQKSVPALLKVYQSIKNLPQGYWHEQKLQELKNIIKECSGLYLEATTKNMFAVQGDSVRISFVADNRLGIGVSVASVKIKNRVFGLDALLPLNENFVKSFTVYIPDTAQISQPYWLVHPMTKGSYTVTDQHLIGKPENDPQAAVVTINFDGEKIDYEIPIKYKTNDPVKGEEFQPVFIVPKIEIQSNPELALSINNKPVKIAVSTINNADSPSSFNIKEAASGNVLKTNPDELKVLKESDASFYSIKEPAKNNTEIIDWTAVQANSIYDCYKKIIEYPHIPNIIYFPKAE